MPCKGHTSYVLQSTGIGNFPLINIFLLKRTSQMLYFSISYTASKALLHSTGLPALARLKMQGISTTAIKK